MPTDKLIVFTSRKIPNNSFKMRGEQICTALKNIGYNAVCMDRNAAKQIDNAVIIWVRRCMVGRKMEAYQKNNINILDPLDRVQDLENSKYYNLQGIIFSSRHVRKTYGVYPNIKNLPQYVLYHHYDPRLTVREFDHFEIGYWGYKYSACHAKGCVDKENWLDNARSTCFPPEEWFSRCSCHYNVRDHKRGAGYRPTTKLSTAAGCGANIVLNREPIYTELLPPDYPYFVDVVGGRGNLKSDYESALRGVEFARATYGTDTWKYGLQCMHHVRKLTNINKCAKLYGRVIDDICERYK